MDIDVTLEESYSGTEKCKNGIHSSVEWMHNIGKNQRFFHLIAFILIEIFQHNLGFAKFNLSYIMQIYWTSF